VAAAADRHQMIVGLQFSDVKAMKLQLAASSYFRLDPDIGDLTKANIDALAFIKENYKTLASFDLKDATLGGGSVPFGEGQSHMKEVLQFIQEKHIPITAYIDCDYPGTGQSTEEVKKCISYVRSCLA
jgi:L-ribulose-5-phosphate 3-epimerase UlaE